VKKTILIPLAGLPIMLIAAALMPDFSGYRTGCGCRSARDSFAHLLQLRAGQLDDEKLVREGLLKAFPPGTSVEGDLQFGVHDTQCSPSTAVVTCNSFYEENDEHRRGYKMIFVLDSQRKITDIQVSRAYRPTTPAKH
jgi:hypothetical protein